MLVANVSVVTEIVSIPSGVVDRDLANDQGVIVSYRNRLGRSVENLARHKLHRSKASEKRDWMRTVNSSKVPDALILIREVNHVRP